MLTGKENLVIHLPSKQLWNLLALTKRWSPTNALHHQCLGCIGTGAALCKQGCSRSPACTCILGDTVLEESGATRGATSHSHRQSPSTCSKGDPELKFLYQGALDDFLLPPSHCRIQGLQKPQWDTLRNWADPSSGCEMLLGRTFRVRKVKEGSAAGVFIARCHSPFHCRGKA